MSCCVCDDRRKVKFADMTAETLSTWPRMGCACGACKGGGGGVGVEQPRPQTGARPQHRHHRSNLRRVS